MSRQNNISTVGVLVFVVIELTLCLHSPVLAQGYPVVDTAAIGEAAENLKAAARQVEELNSMLNQVEGILQAVGKEGLPMLQFQEALSQSGISQFGPPVVDLLAAGQHAVGSFADVLADADKLKGQINAPGFKPDFSSFRSAQNWVNSELTVASGANATAVSLTRKARGMLAGEAAANAYAMALSARQQIASVAARAQQLAQQAGAASNLRGDMAANTAVMLAMHDEMAQVQALLAAVLEVESSARLAAMDPLSTSAASSSSALAGSSENNPQ